MSQCCIHLDRMSSATTSTRCSTYQCQHDRLKYLNLYMHYSSHMIMHIIIVCNEKKCNCSNLPHNICYFDITWENTVCHQWIDDNYTYTVSGYLTQLQLATMLRQQQSDETLQSIIIPYLCRHQKKTQEKLRIKKDREETWRVSQKRQSTRQNCHTSS